MDADGGADLVDLHICNAAVGLHGGHKLIFKGHTLVVIVAIAGGKLIFISPLSGISEKVPGQINDPVKGFFPTAGQAFRVNLPFFISPCFN